MVTHKQEMNKLTGLFDRVVDEAENYLCEIDDLRGKLTTTKTALKSRDDKIMEMDRELDDAALETKELKKRLEEAREVLATSYCPICGRDLADDGRIWHTGDCPLRH